MGDEKRRKTYDDGSVVLVEEATGWEEILGRVVDAFVSPLDTRSVAGRDHQYQLSLSLKEAARGCTKSLSLPRQTRCDVCEGRGFPLEVFPSVCSQCQGAGAIEERRSLRRVVIACEGCAGRGYCLSEPCVGCAGQGRVPLRQEVSIDIPAGVVDGATLVVRGAGQAGTMGGASGDCFVKVQVQPDPVLSIVGSHVTMTRTITALQAMRGDWVVVPTLDGASRLRVPRNALSGSVLRMPGFGVGPELRAPGTRAGPPYSTVLGTLGCAHRVLGHFRHLFWFALTFCLILSIGSVVSKFHQNLKTP